MPRIAARLEAPDARANFDAFRRASIQVMEQAALRATDRGVRRAKQALRSDMQAAGLGRLGNAIGDTSDLRRGRGVKRYPNDGFSASGTLFIRSRSPRTLGAIEAYTQGADIRPVRGRWLWIPTDEIQRVAGSRSQRQRLSPGNWSALGMDSMVGPLVPIRSVNGGPLLVVRNVGVNAGGRPRSARSLTKAGRPRKGQRLKEFVVAFVAIPRTARAARVDVREIVARVQDDLPRLFEEEMRKTRRVA